MYDKQTKEGWKKNNEIYYFGLNENDEYVYISTKTKKFHVGNHSTKVGYDFLLDLLSGKQVDAGNSFNNLKKLSFFPEFLKTRIKVVEGSVYTYASNTISFNQAEILNDEEYFAIRRNLIMNNHGSEMYLSGPSLNKAFESNGDRQIIDSILYSIENGIRQIYLFMTDPVMFNNKAATKDLRHSFDGITDLFSIANRKDCKIHIVYLPLINIDHCIITNEKMLFRTTKFWSNKKDQKGSIMLFDRDDDEYSAQLKFLKKLYNISMVIDLDDDYFIKCMDMKSKDDSYEFHYSLRKTIKDKNYQCVELKRMLYAQLKSYAKSQWLNGYEKTHLSIDQLFDFSHCDKFKSVDELKNRYVNSINDEHKNERTKSCLNTYIRTTETLLKQACEKMSPEIYTDAVIIPSADLGFPNNVVRLAGGFATGELVMWKSGVTLIPVDATVNVCTSSVFKINPKSDILNSFDAFKQYVDKIKYQSEYAGTFKFDSGNHFLAIMQEKSENEDCENNDYYLVLHSSENENKNPYTGLYPNEKCWYNDRIKTEYGQSNRYLRYIFGRDAEFFYIQAKALENANEEVHKKIAEVFFNAEINKNNSYIKHHYGMPNPNTIVIGSFVEPKGEVVPIFSDYGKEIVLFQIGENNWFVDIRGKGKCVLVPHGYGQVVTWIKRIEIEKNELNNKQQLKLVVQNSNTGEQSKTFDINSNSRLNYNKNMDEVLFEKRIRSPKAKGHKTEMETFLNEAGIDGSVVKRLIPVEVDGNPLIYCKKSLE